jgi:hypothetical protein
VRNILPPPGFNPRTVQPVARRVVITSFPNVYRFIAQVFGAVKCEPLKCSAWLQCRRRNPALYVRCLAEETEIVKAGPRDCWKMYRWESFTFICDIPFTVSKFPAVLIVDMVRSQRQKCFDLCTSAALVICPFFPLARLITAAASTNNHRTAQSQLKPHPRHRRLHSAWSDVQQTCLSRCTEHRPLSDGMTTSDTLRRQQVGRAASVSQCVALNRRGGGGGGVGYCWAVGKCDVQGTPRRRYYVRRSNILHCSRISVVALVS